MHFLIGPDRTLPTGCLSWIDDTVASPMTRGWVMPFNSPCWSNIHPSNYHFSLFLHTVVRLGCKKWQYNLVVLVIISDTDYAAVFRKLHTCLGQTLPYSHSISCFNKSSEIAFSGLFILISCWWWSGNITSSIITSNIFKIQKAYEYQWEISS